MGSRRFVQPAPRPNRGQAFIERLARMSPEEQAEAMLKFVFGSPRTVSRKPRKPKAKYGYQLKAEKAAIRIQNQILAMSPPDPKKDAE
jgi:hypothetical protein